MPVPRLYHYIDCYNLWTTAEAGGYSAGLFRRNADVCAARPGASGLHVYALRMPRLPLAPGESAPISERESWGWTRRRRRVCVPRIALGRCWPFARARGSSPGSSSLRGIPCGVVVRSGRFNACTGRTVGSRAGAAVGDGPRRGPVPLSGDGGIGLRAPAEPSHGMLSSRRHRRTPHRRAQGDHTAAARQRYVPPRTPGLLVDAPQNFPGSSDFYSSRPRKTRKDSSRKNREPVYVQSRL